MNRRLLSLLKILIVCAMTCTMISAADMPVRVDNNIIRFPEPIRVDPDFRPFPFPRPPFPRPLPRPLPPSPPKKSPITTLADFFKREVYRVTEQTGLPFASAPPGYALSTDKAVYRPGETVSVQIYFYNKYDKSPDSRLKDVLRSNPKVILRDGRDQQVASVKQFFSDGPVLTCELKVASDQPGGFYRLEFSNTLLGLVQRQSVYILSFGSPNEVLTIDTNKDVVTGGDQIIAQVALRLLKREPRDGELANLQIGLRAVDSSGKQLASASVRTDATGSGIATLRLPASLENARKVTILAQTDFAGRRVSASKDLKRVSLDQLVIQFRPGTGKWMLGAANRVYFRAFASRTKKAVFVVERAHVVVRKAGTKKDRRLKKLVSSEDNGMGRFSLRVRKGFEYYLRVAQDGDQRDFLIVSGNAFKSKAFSNVQIKLNKHVLRQNSVLQVSVRRAKRIAVKSMWLVIQDKTKVLHESEITFKNRAGKKRLPVSKLGLPNGGVVTVQLFRKRSFGTPDQEVLVYLHPRKRLPIRAELDKTVYTPGNQVRVTVAQAKQDKRVLWGIIVSDENASLQLEKKRHPPSLITKVFLENEVYFDSKEFLGAYKYIDWFFENGLPRPSGEQLRQSNRQLDVLLGNQGWRALFLAGDKIRKIARSNDALGKKGHYEYLLARKLADLRPEPEFIRFRARPMMAFARGPRGGGGGRRGRLNAVPQAFAGGRGPIAFAAERGPRAFAQQRQMNIIAQKGIKMERVGFTIPFLNSSVCGQTRPGANRHRRRSDRRKCLDRPGRGRQLRAQRRGPAQEAAGRHCSVRRAREKHLRKRKHLLPPAQPGQEVPGDHSGRVRVGPVRHAHFVRADPEAAERDSRVP